MRLMFESLEARQLLVGVNSDLIIVDQFGWRDGVGKKVAIFADPINGQNAALSYTPGATFQVRRSATDDIVFTGNTVTWRAGATDAVSGDKVWHGDFSSVTAPGEYYIYDPANNLRSYNFILNADVYNDVLTASLRTYYYQRQGTAIPAQFGGNWTHAIDHQKDLTALLWNGAAVPGTARDVAGGWYDAGDYNKYVPFTTLPLWNLLQAYEWNPSAFSDRNNIPESGNGVPDILDEIKWELQWLRKMQNPDGSVLNRVANPTYATGNADPATDTQNRYYTAATTWATASFAASLAHASRVFQAFDATYAATLLTAATNAWNYLTVNPSMLPASGSDGGPGLAAAGAGSNAAQDLRYRILASAELFKTTGNTAYRSYFDANYNLLAGAQSGFHPLHQTPKYLDASLTLELNRAYYTYATTTGATSSIVTELRSTIGAVNQSWLALGEYLDGEDPYRAFMWSGHYSWGSNQLKSEWATLLLYSLKLNTHPANNANLREAAEEYVHYFHGRNPLSMIYLSNMGAKGANVGGDKSPLEIYHSWFADGSSKYDGASSLYGPAPGYLVGGPNRYYAGGATPPTGEPPMKAFRDWNDIPTASWEVTEPAIYYQAAYTLLLSQFAAAPTPAWLQYKAGGAAHFTGSGMSQTLNVTGGTVWLTGDAFADRPGLSLNVTGGATVIFKAAQKFSSVSIDAASRIDLEDEDLIVDYSTVSPIGTWNGSAYSQLTGHLAAGRIRSSSATSNGYTMLGIAEPAAVLGIALSQTALFSGKTVDASSVLIKFTYGGDANLSGNVDIDDYGLIDFNASTGGALTGWFNGDFDYTGQQDIDDYGIIDFVINIQGLPL